MSKSSVSLWVRDVEFVSRPRNRGHRSMKPHPLHVACLAEIERCRIEGIERIGQLSEREFLVLGLALYAGEGSKTRNDISFANSDPRMILLFVTWLAPDGLPGHRVPVGFGASSCHGTDRGGIVTYRPSGVAQLAVALDC